MKYGSLNLNYLQRRKFAARLGSFYFNNRINFELNIPDYFDYCAFELDEVKPKFV